MNRRFLSRCARPAGGRRVVSVTALATAAVLGGAGLGQAATSANPYAAPGSGTTAAAGGNQSVTLQLAPQDPATVRRLANSGGLNRAARLRALATAQPAGTTATRVRNYLAGQGLTVTRSTPLSVTVTGPATTVRSLFGTDGGGLARRPGLHLPPALRGLATAAVGGDDTARVLRPALSPVTGAQVRTAYQAPAGTVQSGKATPTIATLQFSGWNNSDLTSFAAGRGYPDPVASQRYTAVSVDGASPSTPDGGGGEQEVALDQEALLDTAPNALQRAYFAPNSIQGFVDAVNAVAADAANANAGYHITALSISWGGCEPRFSAASLTALSQAFTSLAAAGVTAFAASGDVGAYGCSSQEAPNNALAVDYPASDPTVVGVGGTTLDVSSPHSPSAPAERVWWTPSGTSGFQGYGGGGGASSVFSRPSYQAGAAPTSSARMVPDISLDADPSTGMQIVVNGTGAQVGGTSLASPLAAATFTDLLASNGIDSGLGDIHAALYSGRAGAFRDITSGTNGAYSATTGYDAASGLGAPQWTALAPALIPALSSSRFVPVTPCRVFDTRSGTTNCPSGSGSPKAKIGAQQTLSVTVAGANGVPAGATAVVLNVTAVSPSIGTYVSVYPTGAVRPTASNLNLSAGQAPTPNLVIVPIGTGGKVSFFNANGTVDLLADISGYYTTTTGSRFMPVAPCRVFDTRSGTTSCPSGSGSPKAKIGAQQTLDITVAGANGVPAGATAVVLNVTAVSPSIGTYVSVYPTGAVRPTTSNLNLSAGQAPTPNLVIVPIGTDGKVSFFNANGTVDLLADISGYYTTTGGGLFYPVTPCRVFDTRSGTTSCPSGSGSPKARIGARQTLSVKVAGANGIPAGATAVVLNVTAVAPSAGTYITAFPTGTAQPATSNLNLKAGQAPTPNLVIVPIGTDGKVSFFNSYGTVDLLADVSGYVL